jgi:hypothetical protein
MADFQSAAPVEPNKIGDYLHERSRIPAAPERSAGHYWTVYGGFIVGVLFALAVSALVFELRDAWESHRDWVPPAAMVPAVLGAVALGHLASRARVNAIALPAFLLFIAASGPQLNLWMHHEFPEKDGISLAITIVSALCLGIATVWLLVALLWTEATDPTHAPEPEM